jgi:hypothetical protein
MLQLLLGNNLFSIPIAALLKNSKTATAKYLQQPSVLQSSN